MWNRLQFVFWPLFCFSFFLNFTVLAHGQNTCEGEPLGSPLGRDLIVTSPFNPPGHYGTDYKAADGDNVLAVADGTIRKIGYQVKQLPKPNPRTGLTIRGWGRYVVVDHTDGSQTLYAHLLMDSTNDLSDGIPITKGTIIGKADSTGGVTGPHLHLEYSPAGEIFDNKSKVDPEPCIDNKPVECGTSKIGYTTQQLSINQTQTLTVTNPDLGATYTWNVTSGGGSISPTAGTSVTYTAPASNPNCYLNPIIQMSTGGVVCDTLQIAVNAGTGSAYLTNTNTNCLSDDCECGGGYDCGCYCYNIPYYNCNGSYGGLAYTQNYLYCGCTGVKRPWGSGWSCWTGDPCGGTCNDPYDIRSAAQKAAGCCPAALLPK